MIIQFIGVPHYRVYMPTRRNGNRTVFFGWHPLTPARPPTTVETFDGGQTGDTYVHAPDAGEAIEFARQRLESDKRAGEYR